MFYSSDIDKIDFVSVFFDHFDKIFKRKPDGGSILVRMDSNTGIILELIINDEFYGSIFIVDNSKRGNRTFCDSEIFIKPFG